MLDHTAKSLAWILLLLVKLTDGRAANATKFNAEKCAYDKVLMRIESCFKPARATDDEVWGRRPVTTLDGLEARLRRSMESLSIRVLRGVRRMETLVKDVEKESPEQPKPFYKPNRYPENIVTLKTDTSSRSMNDMPACNTPAETTDPCPEMFTSLTGWESCYMFSNFNTTWHHARDLCSAVEANLVAVETDREQQLISLLIKQKSGIKDAVGWWSSGNYVSQSQQWMWTSQLHLKQMSYSHWEEELEPVGVANMKCMFLSEKQRFDWVNDLCTSKYNFICEKSKA
ncbi:uncharacterized protein LOC141906316 [Tubulanus polymorphus]|uniref:uncharacterized protein LOC141906316 n=1 Tax=Tubulanus polymorphus TaxID=672921 RepID=UPI003DA2CC10